MDEPKMRVIMLTQGGTETVLERLLCVKPAKLVGVFVETVVARRYSLGEKVRRSIRYDGYGQTAAKITRKLLEFRGSPNGASGQGERDRDRLREIAIRNGVPIHFITNYHTPDAIMLMRSVKADLGVVCGTNILKDRVFSIPRLGSINLHMGLAPHYRGGPAVFWELFNGEEEIGLTVHFVESKVDSGDIVLQDKVPLVYDYSHGLDFESFIAEFRNRVADQCAELLAEAVRQIAQGTASRRPQDTSIGRRYRLPTKKEKDELRLRLHRRRQAQASERR